MRRRAVIVPLALALVVALVATRDRWVLAANYRLGFVRSHPVQVRIPSVESAERRPVVLLSEFAGFGPWVRVFAYDDGGVIVERGGPTPEPERIEGTLGRKAVQELARHVRDAIGRSELRRELEAEDGPRSVILVRVDDVWTVDRAAGMSPSGVETVGLTGFGFEKHPWSRFFDVMTELTTFHLHDVHPWVPATIDLCLYSADYARTADPWPDTLPAPPLDQLARRWPPCFAVAAAYEEPLRTRPRLPDTWAVALSGHSWQLTSQVHLPGEGVFSEVCSQADLRRGQSSGPP